MHYLFSTLTITLVCCAPFVFYFHHYVGVLRSICLLLLLFRWCFARYFFLLFLLRWCVAHHLFSTFANMLVFCALFIFYFKYHVGVLRTYCFLLSLLHWCFAHNFFLLSLFGLMFCALFVFYFNYYVGVLRTICFLL